MVRSFSSLALSCFLIFVSQQSGSAKNSSEWVILFNGSSLDSWQSSTTPENVPLCWRIENGELISLHRDERNQDVRASLLTRDSFSDFELAFEFKLDAPEEKRSINSGIKYFTIPNTELGLEYQIFAHIGEIKGLHATGDLYDILPATGAVLKPFDEWNSGRIISHGNLCEHWLNDVKILEYERGADVFKAAIQNSKFKNQPGFGERREGQILLQDHGGGVRFRNIKIRQ